MTRQKVVNIVVKLYMSNDKSHPYC